MYRTLGRTSKQAFGIKALILEKMLLARSGNNLRGVRDQALLLLAYDSMCRRSELVSLRVTDIQIDELVNYTQIKVRLRKSKTDQERHGRWIFLAQRSSNALSLWLNQEKLKDGFLFRGINNAIDITKDLKGAQINHIYKRLAKDANISKEIIDPITGHSMRIGVAQDLLKSAASMPIIMNKSRWPKTDTVMRYLENAGH